MRVLSSDGQEVENGEEADSAEEGWESGEEEEEQEEEERKSSTKKSNGANAIDMRRTVSDSVAPVPTKAGSVKASTGVPEGLPEDQRPHLTQRTTGFAGSVHPAQGPELEQQAYVNAHMPHYNNPAHIRPAHQVRHQQSARSISISRTNTELGLTSALDEDKTPKPSSMSRSGSGLSQAAPRTNGLGEDEREAKGEKYEKVGKRPPPPEQMRSTEGSGLPESQFSSAQAVGTSPSFPFPKLGEEQGSSGKETTTSPTELKQRHSDPPQSEVRRRLVSGPSGSDAPRLRHRYSNSSLRSIQSLRAPPHPLNSPTGGYRMGLSGSRPGSTLNSPVKGKRVPSMHQPPIAPPVVYRTVAQGEGYPIPEEAETPSPASSAIKPPNGHQHTRQSSFSSQLSLQGIMNTSGIKSRVPPSPAPSTASSRLNPVRRRTALEVASAAAKMPTTNNPVEYHHSLGFSSTQSETSHLISRFLPPKKTPHLDWEITQDNLEAHSGIGLSRGDYRDAHESLIRMMREQKGSNNGSRRAANRSLSYQTILGTTSTLSTLAQHATHSLHGLSEDGSSSQGPAGEGLVVAKGGWQGKTPFELSVDRCVAQRPRRR